MCTPADRPRTSGGQSGIGADGVLSAVSFNARAKLLAYFESPLKPPAQQQREIAKYVQDLEILSDEHEFLDIALARQLARECEALLDLLTCGTPERTHRLVQMAVSYFLDPDDDENDTRSPIGFDDDAEVIRLVARELGVATEGET